VARPCFGEGEQDVESHWLNKGYYTKPVDMTYAKTVSNRAFWRYEPMEQIGDSKWTCDQNTLYQFHRISTRYRHVEWSWSK